ncbi:MAG: phospho-sugar mutase [Planctomycetota bacterium]
MMDQLDEALNGAQITATAAENIRKWLTETPYEPYVDEVKAHIRDEKWQALDDAFWTVIPFGTGGRRGRMYPIGCNAINDRTMGESARGLAEYVRDHASNPDQLACALAFDTRHNSEHFARLCAEIMVAAGFTVYFLNEIRSTPELSFLTRFKQCDCGIMITASHNPPSDNAIKCYWSTGGQLLPPHDQGVIERVMQVADIPRVDFDAAVADGKVIPCLEEVDRAFIAAVKACAFEGPRDLHVLYSPLHGVGGTAVVPALAADDFCHVEVFAAHATPDGDFPNVPGHVSNPENTPVFDAIIEHGKSTGADLIMATDPDCDRLGCAAPRSLDPDGEWETFNGNQIGALLTDFVLDKRREAGTLSADHYVVKTLVTTEMVRRIADAYGVRTVGNLLVGFKWIGGVIDECGPDQFVIGIEESHGYLVGQYARDKDGAVAAMLFAELAAEAKAQQKSLHERLEALYWQHGYHAERLVTQKMAGSEGMAKMEALMAAFRSHPPQTLAGLAVVGVRDYQAGQVTRPDGSTEPLDGPRGNLIMLDLAEEGNYVAVRPSGTEPKVKFYNFVHVPAEQLADLGRTRVEMETRLDGLQAELAAFAEAI